MARISFWAALVVVLPISGAHAAHPPKIQEGLWEVHVQTLENPGNKKAEFTYKLCRDHAFDKRADAQVKKAKNCTTTIESIGADRYSAASRCTAAGIVIVSKGLSIYQSATSTHSETVATYSPAFYGRTDQTMIQDQHYVGACPAGLKPGDRLMADGRIVHEEK
jgi:hypothetical protein